MLLLLAIQADPHDHHVPECETVILTALTLTVCESPFGMEVVPSCSMVVLHLCVSRDVNKTPEMKGDPTVVRALDHRWHIGNQAGISFSEAPYRPPLSRRKLKGYKWGNKASR